MDQIDFLNHIFSQPDNDWLLVKERNNKSAYSRYLDARINQWK